MSSRRKVTKAPTTSKKVVKAPAAPAKKRKTTRPKYVGAPEINEDPAVLAARNAPVDLDFSETARQNLSPWIGSGLHVISTSGAQNFCALHALSLSFSAARDLAAPEGTPVPLADNPTVADLLAIRRSDEFWDGALEHFQRDEHQSALQWLHADTYEPFSKQELIAQIQQNFIPDDIDTFDINTLEFILPILNTRYGTHYVLGWVTQGFNVRWNLNNSRWERDYKLPTTATTFGNGDLPIVWIYNDNAELEEASLHRKTRGPDVIGHWMGMHTFQRRTDRYLIGITNSWFGNEVDTDVDDGIWIVTEDIQAQQADIEFDQQFKLLNLFSGMFVREPREPPDEDAPDGYMWARTTPHQNAERVGIVPIRVLKRIQRGALRAAHEIADASYENIVNKKRGVKEKDDGVWQEFLVHRTIEPTFKIDRKYQDPKDPAKKFVGSFQFEDAEFLLDSQENLNNFCPRMIRMDGTSGRVKPRNLQRLESPWGISDGLPIESLKTKRKLGKSATGDSSSTKDSDIRFRPGLDSANFAKSDLIAHCKARGYLPKVYGRRKDGMLELLIKHDEDRKAKDKSQPAQSKIQTKAILPENELPLRRVMADVPKQAGPPKTPPFFATEIVMEIGKGDADNADLWVIDYEGRVGRIDEGNLEPIRNAWALKIDAFRFNVQVLAAIRDKAGVGKTPTAPNSKPKGKKAAGKKVTVKEVSTQDKPEKDKPEPPQTPKAPKTPKTSNTPEPASKVASKKRAAGEPTGSPQPETKKAKKSP